MVIPVYDEEPANRGRPWVTWALVAVNALIAAFLLLLQDEVFLAFAYTFGLVSSFVASGPPEGTVLPFRPELTLLSYSFLHGTWLHLVANMIVLWVFGDNVERATGHLRFLAFYLLCGVAGGVLHIASNPSEAVPLVGASGAVAGVVAAYLLLHPFNRIVLLVLGIMTLKLRAYWVIALWVLSQLVYFSIFAGTTDVAFWSHVGGFGAGLLLIVFMRRRSVPLVGIELAQGAWRRARAYAGRLFGSSRAR
jgi:membrane associated rhomboid family serine protease